MTASVALAQGASLRVHTTYMNCCHSPAIGKWPLQLWPSLSRGSSGMLVLYSIQTQTNTNKTIYNTSAVVATA